MRRRAGWLPWRRVATLGGLAHPSSLPIHELLERAARIVSAPPHLRRTFDLLPQTVRLDGVLVGKPSGLPLAALQLVKLGLLGCQMRLGEIFLRDDDGASLLVLSVGERTLTFGEAELSRDLRSLVPDLLAGLFDGSDTAHVLEQLAFQSSSLATLRSLTTHMLSSSDLDKALYLLLAGITSGYGLGQNRAVLFARDEVTGVLKGQRAIGPHDQAEAHRVWEAIELEDLTIESMIAHYEEGHFDNRLESRVRSMTLAKSDVPDDEVTQVLSGTTDDILFPGPAKNPGLLALGATRDFLLAKVATREGVLGLVFADNLYSKTPIRADVAAHMALFVAQTALVWENLSLLRRVADLAMIDGLTGLLNRRELDARFERERSRAERTKSELSLLIFDVDHFKRVNDENGHEGGDAVLRKLGSILRGSTRAHDIVARYGGDELVAVLPECGPDQAAKAAARIGRAAQDAGTSLSIGVASWPSGCLAPSDLFRVADSELYRAKREGRGCGYVTGTRILF